MRNCYEKVLAFLPLMRFLCMTTLLQVASDKRQHQKARGYTGYTTATASTV